MTSFRLTGSESRGLAESIRILFKLADVEFEDERIAREDMPNRKPEFPLGDLPVLWIDGEPFCQSHALVRYVAKKFGFMGSNLKEELKIDEALEVVNEIIWVNLIQIIREGDADKKKELAETFIKEKLPRYLDFIEKKLKHNDGGRGFYVGKSVTAADVSLYCILFTIKKWLGSMDLVPIQGRPLLEAYLERVQAVPRIAAWVEVRPDTVF